MKEETEFIIRCILLLMIGIAGVITLAEGYELNNEVLIIIGSICTFFGFVLLGREVEKGN